MKRTLAVVVALLSVPACGGSDPLPSNPVESSDDPRRNVMIVDDGMDPGVAAFQGKVAGTYTVVCRESVPSLDAGVESDGGAAAGDGGSGDAGFSFEEVKARWLASIPVKDDWCHVEPGIVPKSDPLAGIARFRDRWNRAIRGGVYPESVFSMQELDEIHSALERDLAQNRIHGTATAGTIAHENPAVRLVLVERRLGDAKKLREEYTCVEQQDVDLSVRLLSDPEIAQAIVASPTSTLTDGLRELRVRHRVGILNESFGPFSRQTLEQLQKMKGCPPVDLTPYFRLQGISEGAWAQAHREEQVLLVKSAGNETSRIDGPADAPECASPRSPRLLVGSYENDGALTDFTNFGACVDIFAPGRYIIAPIPGGWYLTMSGTSFSSPLVARLVSLDRAGPFTANGARDAVLALRDTRTRLAVSRFPRSILFDPERNASRFALTHAAEAPEAGPPLIDRAELRRHLRFLKPRSF